MSSTSPRRTNGRLKPMVGAQLDQRGGRGEQLGDRGGGEKLIGVALVDGLAGLAVDHQQAPMGVGEARRRPAPPEPALEAPRPRSSSREALGPSLWRESTKSPGSPKSSARHGGAPGPSGVLAGAIRPACSPLASLVPHSFRRRSLCGRHVGGFARRSDSPTRLGSSISKSGGGVAGRRSWDFGNGEGPVQPNRTANNPRSGLESRPLGGSTWWVVGRGETTEFSEPVAGGSR